MGSKKLPADTLPVYMPADYVNAILAAIDLLIKADPENDISIGAAKLKEKILKHGRTFRSSGFDSVSIFFFQTEIASLIRVLALVLSAYLTEQKDYFPMIGRVKKQRSDAE